MANAILGGRGDSLSPRIAENTPMPGTGQETMLTAHGHAVTTRIVSQAIHDDQTDAEERAGNGDGPNQLPFAKE
jgi:hypothetical protein